LGAVKGWGGYNFGQFKMGHGQAKKNYVTGRNKIYRRVREEKTEMFILGGSSPITMNNLQTGGKLRKERGGLGRAKHHCRGKDGLGTGGEMYEEG